MVSVTRKNRLPRNAATMSSLTYWYKYVFEHLGWMILAKAKGMDMKVRAYKQSVENLCRSLKHVMTEYENNDKKHDLKIMLMHVELLQRKMGKLL
jgi:hypothetical protein